MENVYFFVILKYCWKLLLWIFVFCVILLRWFVWLVLVVWLMFCMWFSLLLVRWCVSWKMRLMFCCWCVMVVVCSLLILGVWCMSRVSRFWFWCSVWMLRCVILRCCVVVVWRLVFCLWLIFFVFWCWRFFVNVILRLLLFWRKILVCRLKSVWLMVNWKLVWWFCLLIWNWNCRFCWWCVILCGLWFRLVVFRRIVLFCVVFSLMVCCWCCLIMSLVLFVVCVVCLGNWVFGLRLWFRVFSGIGWWLWFWLVWGWCCCLNFLFIVLLLISCR